MPNVQHVAGYLRCALRLAEQRRGFCAPNPSVGAVLVKEGQVLAEGLHKGDGHPHAEQRALEVAGNHAQGATLYVTLEPCCHHAKRTPPCTEAILRAGIAAVVYGCRDPNPAVAETREASEAHLKAAGVQWIHHPLPDIDDFYQSYHFWWRHRRPFVTAKLALSLDGKIAGPQGLRVQITGAQAAAFTHAQRKHTDAILTTARTIRQDNPLLNARTPDGTYRKPVYVLDSHLSLPPAAQIFGSAALLTIFHQPEAAADRHAALTQRGARCVAVPHTDVGLDLLSILRHIGEDGRHELWVEAGGHCFEALHRGGLLQRAFVYTAPIWLGSAAQTAFTGAVPLTGLKPVRRKMLGQDAVWEFLSSEGRDRD